MENIGYWVPAEEPGASNTLVFVLAHLDRDSRQASWKAFMADPEWQAVYKASESEGRLVEKLTFGFCGPPSTLPSFNRRGHLERACSSCVVRPRGRLCLGR
jgi:hypothetical protein